MTAKRQRGTRLHVVETVTKPEPAGTAPEASPRQVPDGVTVVDVAAARPARAVHEDRWGRTVPARMSAELSAVGRTAWRQANEVAQSTAARLGSVTPHEAVAYGGLAVLALLGAIEAPVVAVVAGVAWMTRPTMSGLPSER